MIHGIGVDVVYMPRFQRIMVLYKDKFLNRAFHATEISHFNSMSSSTSQVNKAQLDYVASRWAIKEAAFKAFRYGRVLFPEMYITNEEGGRYPTLKLEGNALQTAERLGIKKYHVSLSHDNDYAFAQVIFEK